ncbi:phosphoprotein phosphatase [Histomonas meleagridis]|uniref:phosphoprotein phosphatase n=1 Tax=Histomonas meleagridis TaxID=135588 RepID=UPI00355A2222|nr:phosphoprotein phosphatase [Histomonas meleagridis]KAH0799940.1 phosphoprotein phosphatase [Histomonas meleagridis]
MLSINLFRTLPKMPAINVVGAHDSMLDSAWPHISLAYNCLLASLNCRHSSNISSSFIYNLVRNCSSPDDRERIAVRDILHTLYTKYMNLRSIVRDKVAAHFAIGNCSTEILEFFVSVVTGFNSPLNPSHITYYYNAILPIHTLENYPTFQAQYVQLILRYITKSGFLLDRTVNYLLMHWPKSCRQKQILFLSEIEELLENFEINVTPQMATSVFKLISKMTMNLNSDVAETAINILMNPKVSFLLKTHASTLYPIIVKYVYKSAKNHWDECIRTNAFVTLQGLSELDSQTFNKVNETLKVRKAKKANQFKANWTEIFEGAKAFDRNIKPI